MYPPRIIAEIQRSDSSNWPFLAKIFTDATAIILKIRVASRRKPKYQVKNIKRWIPVRRLYFGNSFLRQDALLSIFSFVDPSKALYIIFISVDLDIEYFLSNKYAPRLFVSDYSIFFLERQDHLKSFQTRILTFALLL